MHQDFWFLENRQTHRNKNIKPLPLKGAFNASFYKLCYYSSGVLQFNNVQCDFLLLLKHPTKTKYWVSSLPTALHHLWEGAVGSETLNRGFKMEGEAQITIIKHACHTNALFFLCIHVKILLLLFVCYRPVCGIRGKTLIINLPGSKKGSQVGNAANSCDLFSCRC